MVHSRTKIIVLAVTLSCLIAVDVGVAARRRGRDISEPQLAAIHGSDPNNPSVKDAVVTCGDKSGVAAVYSLN